MEELEHFQPTPGYMRTLKGSILSVWHARKAVVQDAVANVEHRAKLIQLEAGLTRRRLQLQGRRSTSPRDAI